MKSSLHIGQGTILKLFIELRAQPQVSVGHKNLGRASTLFLTLYILVKTCAKFF
jgi:hypothetical protein